MSLPLTALVATFAMSAPCFGAVTASAAPVPIIQAAASNTVFAQVGAPSLPPIEDEAPVALEDTPADPYAVTPEDRETILIEAAAALSMSNRTSQSGYPIDQTKWLAKSAPSISCAPSLSSM